jgi:FkbM family methyltransferase
MKNLLLKSQLVASVLMVSGLFADYPQYLQPNKTERNRVARLNNGGGYLDEFYTSPIGRNSDVKSILEIGSRDAKDALKLSEYYKCHVYAFECNPHTLQDCQKNIRKNPNVTLVPYAVWDKTGSIDFYPIVETEGVCYNPGASSCFPVSRSGHHKTYIQEKITVNSIRLDDWLNSQKIPQVDLLCIDAQGATMNILKGLGNNLAGVKYIITELEHKVIYEGETLRDTVDQFLEANGFRMYVGKMNRFFGDYLYVRKDIISGWWGVQED